MNTAALPRLDQLVDQARAELDRRPTTLDLDLMTDEARFWSTQRRRVRWTRVAGLGGTALLIACLGASTRPVGDASFSAVLLGFLVVGLVLCGLRDARAQVLARASLWALAMLGCGIWLLFMPNQLEMLPALADAYEHPEQGGVLGLTTDLLAAVVPLVSLLILGMHGLERPAERDFRPIAFRRLIALSLVLGLADALWLVPLGVVNLSSSAVPHSPVPWILVAGLLFGAWGLYRLRTWGLAAMTLANLVEVLLLLREPELLLGPELMILILTAAVQLILPIPVYTALFRGHTRSSEWAERLGQRIPAFVLALLLLIVLTKWCLVMALS